MVKLLVNPFSGTSTQLDEDLHNHEGQVIIPASTTKILASVRLTNGTVHITAEKMLVAGMEMSIEASSTPIPVHTQETRAAADNMRHFLTYAQPISQVSGRLLFEDSQIGEFVSGAAPFILGALLIDADVAHTIQLSANQSIPLKLTAPISLSADIANAVHGKSFLSDRPTP